MLRNKLVRSSGKDRNQFGAYNLFRNPVFLGKLNAVKNIFLPLQNCAPAFRRTRCRRRVGPPHILCSLCCHAISSTFSIFIAPASSRSKPNVGNRAATSPLYFFRLLKNTDASATQIQGSLFIGRTEYSYCSCRVARGPVCDKIPQLTY